MSRLILILSLFAFFAATSAQVLRFRACPDVPVKDNFEVRRYTGAWYEYERYFAVFEFLGTCAKANYTLKPNGRIDVLNTGVIKYFGTPNQAHGEAYAPDPSVPAKLLVQFDQSPTAGNYWVLDTDYRSYSIVYSCSNLTKSIVQTSAEILWLLTRDRMGPGAEQVAKAEQFMRNLGLSTSDLKKTDQNNCPN